MASDSDINETIFQEALKLDEKAWLEHVISIFTQRVNRLCGNPKEVKPEIWEKNCALAANEALQKFSARKEHIEQLLATNFKECSQLSDELKSCAESAQGRQLRRNALREDIQSWKHEHATKMPMKNAKHRKTLEHAKQIISAADAVDQEIHNAIQDATHHLRFDTWESAVDLVNHVSSKSLPTWTSSADMESFFKQIYVQCFTLCKAEEMVRHMLPFRDDAKRCLSIARGKESAEGHHFKVECEKLFSSFHSKTLTQDFGTGTAFPGDPALTTTVDSLRPSTLVGKLPEQQQAPKKGFHLFGMLRHMVRRNNGTNSQGKT